MYSGAGRKEDKQEELEVTANTVTDLTSKAVKAHKSGAVAGRTTAFWEGQMKGTEALFGRVIAHRLVQNPTKVKGRFA